MRTALTQKWRILDGWMRTKNRPKLLFMSNPEIPLQQDMFSGALVDTRTAKQKEQDKLRALPQPLEMFPQSDIAQFGVVAHPLLPINDNTRLGLVNEDPRTDAERERDLEREAQRHMAELFPAEAKAVGEYLFSQVQPITDPHRLLAANSVVSDKAIRREIDFKQYLKSADSVVRNFHEKCSFLHLLATP